MLEISNLTVSYGHIQAVTDINLQVRQGEIVTLIGSNGAGKSSTLKAISGLVRNTRGTIAFEGQELRRMPPDRIVSRGLSQVPEGRKIFPRLSVEENLEIGAYLEKDKSLIQQRKERAFVLFPILEKRRHQKGGTLSGGEQQMLAMARALMQAPRMLLLDEPSMGLAPVLVDFIFETIQQLNKEGMTILLVEQNARLALQIAHRGYVLQNGTVLMEGPAQVLAGTPHIQEAYLGGL